MRTKRKLAGWSRKELERNGLDQTDEEVAAALAALMGKPAIYHCLSRIVDRRRVLKREERDMFVSLMRRYEAFSQVKVLTYCVMSNHFHIELEVPETPEDGGASWSDERLLKHLELIYKESKIAELRWELTHLRKLGDLAAVEEFRARFFNRMWDLSEYMKIVKQCFSQWFNRKHGRCGVLWEDRFKSELVEDGHAARRVAAYIDLNPVRAGLKKDPKDWCWSGYGEAMGGGERAVKGLQWVLLEDSLMLMNEERAAKEVADPKQVLCDYRVALFAAGEEHLRDERLKRGGISREQVERVLAEGGRLSEAEMLLCRTRYFMDGVAIGSEGFINHLFILMRENFGPKRKTGARRMRGVKSSLCTLRDLQKKPLLC